MPQDCGYEFERTLIWQTVEGDMAGTDEADDNRLIGRMPRPARRSAVGDARGPCGDADRDDGDCDSDGDSDEAPHDQEIDAVTRLMGFLRGTDDA